MTALIHLLMVIKGTGRNKIEWSGMESNGTKRLTYKQITRLGKTALIHLLMVINGTERNKIERSGTERCLWEGPCSLIINSVPFIYRSKTFKPFLPPNVIEGDKTIFCLHFLFIFSFTQFNSRSRSAIRSSLSSHG